MKLTATLSFDYTVPDEDWAIQYDDDDIGVQAEKEFLTSIIIAGYGGQEFGVEITSLELGVVEHDDLQSDEWYDNTGVSTQQPLDGEEVNEDA